MERVRFDTILRPIERFRPNKRFLDAVARLLSSAFGHVVELGGWEELRANKAYRVAILKGGPPWSVILKKARPTIDSKYDPQAESWNPSWRFLAEWAALDFLNGVAQHICPAFYGGNRDLGFIAFEDLGNHPSLADLLRGDDGLAAANALIAHAAALGRIHALTFGRADDYHAVRDQLGPRVRQTDDVAWSDLDDSLERVRQSLVSLGIGVTSGLESELAELTVEIVNSRWQALTHCDASPENALMLGTQLRFVDFERAGYHHCFIDAACGRLCFPHAAYVLKIPKSVVLAMETAYRTELIHIRAEVGIQQAFSRQLALAAAYWLVSNGTLILSQTESDSAGILQSASKRQRVLMRLGTLAELAADGGFPGIGTTCLRCIEKLEEVWGRTEPMSSYPAFSGIPD